MTIQNVTFRKGKTMKDYCDKWWFLKKQEDVLKQLREDYPERFARPKLADAFFELLNERTQKELEKTKECCDHKDEDILKNFGRFDMKYPHLWGDVGEAYAQFELTEKEEFKVKKTEESETTKDNKTNPFETKLDSIKEHFETMTYTLNALSKKAEETIRETETYLNDIGFDRKVQVDIDDKMLVGWYAQEKNKWRITLLGTRSPSGSMLEVYRRPVLSMSKEAKITIANGIPKLLGAIELNIQHHIQEILD